MKRLWPCIKEKDKQAFEDAMTKTLRETDFEAIVETITQHRTIHEDEVQRTLRVEDLREMMNSIYTKGRRVIGLKRMELIDNQVLCEKVKTKYNRETKIYFKPEGVK